MILNTPVEDIAHACRGPSAPWICGTASVLLSKRVLVLVGEQDPLIPVSVAESIRGGIASSELRVIPHAAHFVNVEQSEAFNKTLVELIKRIDKELKGK